MKLLIKHIWTHTPKYIQQNSWFYAKPNFSLTYWQRMKRLLALTTDTPVCAISVICPHSLHSHLPPWSTNHVLRKGIAWPRPSGSEAMDIVYIAHSFCFCLLASKTAQSHLLTTDKSQTIYTTVTTSQLVYIIYKYAHTIIVLFILLAYSLNLSSIP